MTADAALSKVGMLQPLARHSRHAGANRRLSQEHTLTANFERTVK
jgi:hypothetical protein